MSSNKTENYGLHLWEAADNFLRAEFNENSQLVDAALAGLSAKGYAFGSYEGDGGGARIIELGFAPQVALIWNHPTSRAPYYNYGIMLLTSQGCTCLYRTTSDSSFVGRYSTLLRCTDTGLTLDGPVTSDYYFGNMSGVTYYYLALK